MSQEMTDRNLLFGLIADDLRGWAIFVVERNDGVERNANPDEKSKYGKEKVTVIISHARISEIIWS